MLLNLYKKKWNHGLKQEDPSKVSKKSKDNIKEINRLVKENLNVIIGAYALGKAQRLTQLITKNFPNTNVYIHPDLEAYHRIYEQHGFDLGKWKPFRRTEFDNETSSFYIVPPAYFRRYSLEKNVFEDGTSPHHCH